MQGSIRTKTPRSRYLSAILLLYGSSASCAAPSRYVCNDEQSVGLHYDKPPGHWAPHAFVPARYVLRKLTLEDQDGKVQKYAPLLSAFPEAAWAFFEYGGEHPQPLAACREGRLEYAVTFLCEPISVEARFDPVSRRFQIIRGQGFIAQAMTLAMRKDHPKEFAVLEGRREISDPDKPDDLVIEIGICKAD